MGENPHLLILVFLFFLSLVLVLCDDTSLQNECSSELTKLTACLDYATLKSDTPSGPCCSSVSGIRSKDPECLCFIIQQTNHGGSSVKTLGLRMDRLIQLPQACKVANASVSDCPKLLNLSPGSPDASIFTNTTKATSSPTTGTVNPKSNEGVRQKIRVGGGGTFAILVLSPLFLSIFSVGA